jgi:hypothetical protein
MLICREAQNKAYTISDARRRAARRGECLDERLHVCRGVEALVIFQHLHHVVAHALFHHRLPVSQDALHLQGRCSGRGRRVGSLGVWGCSRGQGNAVAVGQGRW